MEERTIVFLIGIFFIALGTTIGYFFGTENSKTTIQTISETMTTTNTQTRFLTTTQTTTDIRTATVTDTTSTTVTATTTSLTSTTLTKTLGTGITITDYKLFETDVLRDSVLKLNLTINFVSDYPTSVIEQAIVILTPTNGNAADIKFVPNPIITQSSGLSLTLSMFTIIDHQIMAGTYMIEYAVSTSQGSALVFTVLEIT